MTFLDQRLIDILNEFEAIYGMTAEKVIKKDINRAVQYIPVAIDKTSSREDAILTAVETADAAEHSVDIIDTETTANQLYSHLFEACNILRGPIDQDDYKSYVIPILFFKRLSDVYDEETAENEQKYGDDIEFYPEDELRYLLNRKS